MLGVVRRFGNHDFVFFGGNSEFVVEEVLEDLLDALEVTDDALLDRFFHDEEVLLGTSFMAYVAVFLVHTY